MRRTLGRTLRVFVVLGLACGGSGDASTTDASAGTGTGTGTGTGGSSGSSGSTANDMPTTSGATMSGSSGGASSGGPTTSSGEGSTSTGGSSSGGEEGPNAYVPCGMGCPEGYSPVGVGGTPCVCLPGCDPGNPMCPPSPVGSANAICFDTFIGGNRCALECPGAGQDDACPAGMVCLNFSGQTQLPGCSLPGCPICMWP